MASCGKANLLLTSKFKQYRGLCAEFESTSRKMTADDMQGFWELILLQVEDVNKMFTALRSLKENNWVIPKSPMPKKKGASTPRTPAANKKKPREKSAAQKARDEERRKMLLAKKLEMKKKMQENGNVPEVIIT
ncbi:disks large-associated protein 4-like [Bolinopsis microptera]|uniref:disks large-associated protein 4-like n=1 Tax=Bolinopsis microptera TaxID=2820187 RepID=UPI003079A4FA